jgi:epoxyqueuosine reductase QueG
MEWGELSAADDLKVDLCLHCGKCQAACPTGGDGCLSEITQRKGELTESQIGYIKKGGMVWGCDMCQNACPLNDSAEETPIAFFRKERIASLDREVLSMMSDEEFKKRAFSWRGRGVLERNIKILTKK